MVQLIKRILCSLTIIIFVGCLKEESEKKEVVSENIIISPVQDRIQYLELLPLSVQEEFNSVLDKNTSRANTSKKGIIIESFRSKKILVTKNDEGTSYTSYVNASHRNKKKGSIYNLVVQENKNGEITTNILIFEPYDKWKSKKQENPGFLDYSGNISVFDYNGDSVFDLEIDEGKFLKTSSNSIASKEDCWYEARYVIGCVYDCWISEIRIIAHCTDKAVTDDDNTGGTGSGNGTSDGTGGGSGGTTTTTTTETINITATLFDPEYFFLFEDINEEPPSCKSFNFEPDGSNNQEAVVTGIYFNIVLLKDTPPFVSYEHTVTITNAVRFTAPMNLQIGGDLETPILSVVSAAALNRSMRETAKKYAGKKVSTGVVLAYFKNRIKYNYPLFVPGGRAQTNPNHYTHLPTPYKVNPVGYGDCDD